MKGQEILEGSGGPVGFYGSPGPKFTRMGFVLFELTEFYDHIA